MRDLRQTPLNAVFLLAAALVSLVPFALSSEPSQDASADNVVFENEVGTWVTKTYIWSNGNLNRPTVYEGIEVNKLLSNGDCLHRTYTVTAPESVVSVSDEMGNGLTFQYDAKTDEYTGRWDSNRELNRFRLKGKFDKETRTLTLAYAREGTEELGVEKRLITRYIDADTKEVKLSLVQFIDGREEIFTSYKTSAKRKKD